MQGDRDGRGALEGLCLCSAGARGAPGAEPGCWVTSASAPASAAGGGTCKCDTHGLLVVGSSKSGFGTVGCGTAAVFTRRWG